MVLGVPEGESPSRPHDKDKLFSPFRKRPLWDPEASGAHGIARIPARPVSTPTRESAATEKEQCRPFVGEAAKLC